MNDELRLTTCAVDLETRAVRRPDGVVRLTPLEAAVLRSLAERPGEDVARQTLLDRVWGGQGSARTVDFAIRRLRRKLGDPPDLTSSHGVGYRLVPAAALAPTAQRRRPPIAVATGAIDLDRRVFVRAGSGDEARLGRVGGALLDALRSGEPRARDELAHAVWGPGDHADALATTVARLRAVLEPPGAERSGAVLRSVIGGKLRLVVDPVIRTNLGPPERWVPRPELDIGRATVLDARLVCLVGSGGAGKTRLARRIARTLLDDGLVSGAWLCVFGRDGAVERALGAVAAGLGLSLGANPVDAVARGLAALPRDALVVLDNLDPAADVAGLVAGWRSAAPSARFLTTSRAPWAGSDARTIEVGALPVRSGVALYRAVAGDRPAQADAVEALVHRLDGVPLAIELAAARADALPAEVLVDRWNERLGLLIAGAVGARPPVADALDALLTPTERAVLARLALFEAPFPDDRACAVAAVDAGALAALVAGALLRRQPDGRLTMHESVRAYARGLGADPDARGRWLRLHLDLASALSTPLDAARFPALLAIAPELRAISPLALTDIDRAELGWALGITCEIEGFPEEADRVYAAALPIAPPRLAWQMMAGRGRRSFLGGDDDAALAYALDALEVAQAVDPASGAAARIQVANAQRRLGRLDDAVGTLGRALAVYRRLDLPDDVAYTHGMLATIHVEAERFGAAFEAYREAHRVAQTAEPLAQMTLTVADAWVRVGDLDQAEAAVDAVAEVTTPFANVHALKVRAVRASIAILRGDRDGVDAELGAVATGFAAVGQPNWVHHCATIRAGLALRDGRPDAAKRLLGEPVTGWRSADPRALLLGWVAAYEGSPADGLRALDAIPADSPSHRPMFDVGWLGLRAILEAQRGRLDRAAALAEEARALAAGIEAPGRAAPPWIVHAALVDGFLARSGGRADEARRALAWARRQRSADGYRQVELGLGAFVVAGLLSGRAPGGR